METDEVNVYAMRIGNKNNSVYHKLESVKKIISDGYSERIIFDNGEIELTASQNELIISSKHYLSTGESVTTSQIVKNLIAGYNPQSALKRAKIGILQRVVNLEMRAREEETAKEMRNHLKLEYGFATKQTPKAPIFDSQKVAEEFLLAERKAV
jgi:hypothetical protein